MRSLEFREVVINYFLVLAIMSDKPDGIAWKTTKPVLIKRNSSASCLQGLEKQKVAASPSSSVGPIGSPVETIRRSSIAGMNGTVATTVTGEQISVFKELRDK